MYKKRLRLTGMQYSVMVKSPNRRCPHCKAKRGERAGSLLFWSVPQVKKEINSCAQGVNASLDKTSWDAGPLDVLSLHLCSVAHTWVLPMVVSDLWCSAVLESTPNIMARVQGVGYLQNITGYLQNITACCRSAPSFLLCAALVTNVGVSSVPTLIQELCPGNQ